MVQIETGRARPEEIASCLALLPKAAALRPILLAARIDGVVGGAAGLLWQAWSEPAGFPLLLHVAAEHRRQGVGRALLAAATDLARDEVGGTWSEEPVPQGGDAASFLAACGFEARRRQFEYELPFTGFADLVGPNLARLRAEGRMPPDAQVMPLSEALLPAVAAVIGPAFQKTPAAMLALWRSCPAALDMARSSALLVNGRLVGAMLVDTETGVPVIDALAVAAEHRGGGAGALLLAEGAQRAAASGVQVVRFRCEEDARIPLAIAQAAGGVLVETRLWFHKVVA